MPVTSVPSKVRICAVPPDHLRSEISISRTCNNLNIISYILYRYIYISHSPFNTGNASLVVYMHGCAVGCSLKYFLSVKFFRGACRHVSFFSLLLLLPRSLYFCRKAQEDSRYFFQDTWIQKWVCFNLRQQAKLTDNFCNIIVCITRESLDF